MFQNKLQWIYHVSRGKDSDVFSQDSDGQSMIGELSKEQID